MNNLSNEDRKKLEGLARIEIRRWACIPDKQYMVDLMNIATNALEQQGDWIDLAEKEPPLGCNCFVWMAGGFPAVIRITNRSLNDRDFTHWMKVPEPPQPKTDTTPQIDNDGWIAWGGGECPVPKSCWVEAKLRNGKKDAGWGWIAEWRHTGNGYDILAYRVIENDGREG